MLVVVAMASWWDSPWVLPLPMLAVLAYLVVGLVQEPRTFEDMTALADRLYLICYTGSLGAVGCWVFRIGLNPSVVRDLRIMALALATAIFCSVAGLIALLVMKSYARHLPGSSSTSVEFERAINNIANALGSSAVPGAVAQLVEDLRQAPTAVRALRDVTNSAESQLAQLAAGLQQLNVGLTRFASLTYQSNEQVTTISDSLLQLDQVLDNFALALASRLNAVASSRVGGAHHDYA